MTTDVLYRLRSEWFGNVRADVLAGLVVALALIPEAIAFSIIAGVDPKVGLYASFCIAVVIAFTGGRPGMISAATGAMALVMVDLNLAGASGLDILAARAAIPALRRIPAVVFTTSSSPADVDRAYELGANAVVTKPADLDEYFNTIRAIVDFWFRTATRPGAC